MKRILSLAGLGGTLVIFALSCTDMRDGPRHTTIPTRDESPVLSMKASYYGKDFEGQKTASGAVFDSSELTAAHRTLPFGTRLHLTNVENGRTTTVVVNDRGPYVKGRDIDVSEAAARRLGFKQKGEVSLEARVVKESPGEPVN